MSDGEDGPTEQAADAGSRMVKVTYPDGRIDVVSEAEAENLPAGTMLEWSVTTKRGHKEMRWTVVGGGWPFDD